MGSRPCRASCGRPVLLDTTPRNHPSGSMWACTSLRLDWRLTQSTVEKRSSATRICQYRHSAGTGTHDQASSSSISWMPS